MTRELSMLSRERGQTYVIDHGEALCTFLLVLCLAWAASAGEVLLDPMSSAERWSLTGQYMDFSLGKCAMPLRVEVARPGFPSALGLFYDFSRGRNWVGVRHHGPAVPGICRSISLWVRGNNSGHNLRLRLEDADGRFYARTLCPVDWEGWRQVQVGLAEAGWQQTLRVGDERRPPRQPVTVRQIEVVQVSGADREGTVYFQNLRADATISSVDAVEMSLATGQPANVFYRPMGVQLSVECRNSGESRIAARLSVAVQDYFGGQKVTRAGELLLAPGASERRAVDLGSLSVGWYSARATLTCSSRQREAAIRFGVSEPLRQPKLDEDSPFGMGIYLNRFGEQERELALRLASEAGVKWSREDYTWASLESRPGEWAWLGAEWAEGPHGKCLRSRGRANVVVIPNSPSLRAPSRSGEVTIAWRMAIHHLDPGSEWRILFQKWGGVPEHRDYCVFYQTSTRMIAVSLGDGTTRYPEVGCDRRDWQANRWYHLAFTYRRNGELRWYVDGQAAGSGARPGPALIATSGDFLVGDPGGTLDYSLNDLRLYDRVLSPDEVAALSVGKLPKRGPNLVGCWPFDDGGEAVRDESGYANTGRLRPFAQDGLAGQFARHGVRIFGLTGFAPTWAAAVPPKDGQPASALPRLEPWSKALATIVRHFSPGVRYWEMWNEPNVDVFWQPKANADEYAQALAVAYPCAKLADPNCKVLGVSLGGPTDGAGLEFIERVLKHTSTAAMDIMSIHPYRFPRAPEDSDLIGEVRRVADLMDHHGGRKPLWLTELGWPTVMAGHGSSERWQAQVLVRAYLQSIASGVVGKIFWYDFRDDGSDRSYIEHCCGILERDFTPKPSYFAYRAMATTLAGLRFRREVSLGKRCVGYVFEGNGQRVLATWATEGSWPVVLTAGRSSVMVTDLMGRVRQMPPGVCTLTLTSDPVFVSGLIAPEAVRPLLEVTGDPPKLAPGETAPIAFSVINPLPHRAEFQVRLGLPAGKGLTCAPTRQWLRPGEIGKVKLPIHASPHVQPGRRQVPLVFTSPGLRAEAVMTVRVARVPATAGPVAYWPCDEGEGEVAQDASDHGHDLRLHGATWSARGRVGAALTFGPGAYADAGSPPGLALTDEVTLACWVNIAGPNGDWQVPIMKFRGDQDRNCGLGIHRDDGIFCFSGSFRDVDSPFLDFWSGERVWGGWHHLVGTYSANDEQVRLYLDRKLVKTVTVAGGPLHLIPEHLLLGTNCWSKGTDGQPVPGLLDDVRIYSRVLTDEEIVRLP